MGHSSLADAGDAFGSLRPALDLISFPSGSHTLQMAVVLVTKVCWVRAPRVTSFRRHSRNRRIDLFLRDFVTGVSWATSHDSASHLHLVLLFCIHLHPSTGNQNQISPRSTILAASWSCSILFGCSVCDIVF
jgi:hypothetical protein